MSIDSDNNSPAGDFLIIFAPNGSFPAPLDVEQNFGAQAATMGFAHTPQTLASEAIKAIEHGAGMLHIHPRLLGKTQYVKCGEYTYPVYPGDPVPDYWFFESVMDEIRHQSAAKGMDVSKITKNISYENSVSVLSRFGNVFDQLAKNYVGPVAAGSALGIPYTTSIPLTSPTDIPDQSTALPEFRELGIWQWARPKSTFNYDPISPDWVWRKFFDNYPELEKFYDSANLAVSEGHSTISPVVNFFHKCAREMDIGFTMEMQAPRTRYVWEELMERGMVKAKPLTYAEWEKKIIALGVYDSETGKTWLDRAKELAPKKWDPREPLEDQKFFEMQEGFVQMLFGHEVFYPVKSKDGKHFNEQFIRDELDWIILKFQPQHMSLVGAWIYDNEVFKDYLNFASIYVGPGEKRLDALRVGHEHLPPSLAGKKGDLKPDIDAEFNPGNSDQVQIAADIIRANGRILVKPEEANKFLGFTSNPSQKALAARARFAEFQQPFVDNLMSHRKLKGAKIIVGAGDAGTSVVHSFSQTPMPETKIIVFDKAPVAGPGIPYSSKHNLPSDKMNLQGNETFRDDRDHFMEWVRKQPDERLIRAGILNTLKSESPKDYKKYEAGEVKLKDLLQDHWINPRILVGEFLQDLYQESVRALEAKGNVVTTHLQTEVTDAIRVNGQWQVTFRNQDSSTGVELSDDLILTNGYGAQKGQEKAGYYATAYPAQKIIDNTNLSQPIAQIGSNVYGAEVPTKFNAGTYERQTNGRLKFTPHPGNEKFHITVFSISGMFPAVKGFTDNYEPSILTQQNIETLVKRNNGYLPLDGLINLFKREIAHSAPELANAYLGWEKFNFEELSQLIQGQYESTRASGMLAKNIDLARESRTNKVPIPWQNPLMLTFVWLDQYLDRLSAEDRMRWDESFSPITRSVMLIQLDVAEKLLALMEAGALDIIKVPQGVETKLDDSYTSGASIVIKNGDGTETSQHFATVIRAGGTEPDIRRNSSPLIQSLIQQGYLCPALVPFRDQKLGKRLFESSPADQFIEQDERYYLNVGGIDRDNEGRVIPSPSLQAEGDIRLIAPQKLLPEV